MASAHWRKFQIRNSRLIFGIFRERTLFRSRRFSLSVTGDTPHFQLIFLTGDTSCPPSRLRPLTLFTTTQNLPYTQCRSALVSRVVSQLHVALVLDSATNLKHKHHPKPNASSSTRVRRSLLTRNVRSRPKLPVRRLISF